MVITNHFSGPHSNRSGVRFFVCAQTIIFERNDIGDVHLDRSSSKVTVGKLAVTGGKCC